MKNFLEKIAAADFRRPARRLVILTLAVVLSCSALSAYMFRTQISEAAALRRSEAQSVRETKAGDGGEDGRDREEAGLIDSGLITRPSAAAAAAGIASIVLCGLCALACWLTAAAWLFKASSKAGMNRALWGILGLLACPAAAAAFLIVRGRMARCPACGARLAPVCPACGRVCSAADCFCPGCGAALRAESSAEAGRA